MKKRNFWILFCIVVVVLGIVFLNNISKTNIVSIQASTKEPVQLAPQLTNTPEPLYSLVEPVYTKIPDKSEELISPEPSSVPIDESFEETLSCSLTVRCDDILKNMEKLTSAKKDLIPQNGLIFLEKSVEFKSGESVFDILYREMRNNKIHMEFVNTPMYNSAYIEGIANIYEFDCGNSSGWTYTVNGVRPKVGCSQYIIEDKDIIEFVYICSLYGN